MRQAAAPVRTTLQRLALVAAIAVLAAQPAAGDWLVTRDEARLETRGPWEVRGSQVVFTLPNGMLSSLPLDEVDLDASEAATEAARAAAEAPAEEPPPPPPPKEPVLVLTDADVGPARRRAAVDPGEEEAASGAAAAPTGEDLVVADWQAVDETFADGIVITGQLHNPTADVHGNVRLTVRLYDNEGALLQSAQADLSTTTLQPGSRASFTATLSGVFAFAGARFETDSLPVSTRQDSAPARVRPQDQETFEGS